MKCRFRVTLPGTEGATQSFNPDPDALQFIMSMGFTRDQAVKALKATDNNPERAADWIFSHQDELNSTDEPAAPEFRDGDSSKFIYIFTILVNKHAVIILIKESRIIIIIIDSYSSYKYFLNIIARF